MRKMLVLFLLAASAALLSAADDVTGLWRGVDDETGETTMFTYVYEYEGRVFGRMVVIYKDGVMSDPMNAPVYRAEEWQGNPYFAGMDIIWNLEPRGSRWKRGKICDPVPGKIYDCEMWRDGENLVVRGKIGPFGRNQIWRPVRPSDLPEGLDYGDPSDWVPVIPRLK